MGISLLLTGCSSQTRINSDDLQNGINSDENRNESEAVSAEPLTPDSLEQLLQLTNARRAAVIKPVPDVDPIKNWNADDAEAPVDISAIEFSFEPAISESEIYTMEQVQEDLDCLFYFYEVGYGPYYYFGGKEAFDAAKEAIQSDLEDMTEITAISFQDTLIKHLSFVQDAHFAINYNSAVDNVEGYLSEAAFLKDTAGFRSTEDNGYLRQVDGSDEFSENMVLSLTAEGDMIYRYMKLAKDQPESVELLYEDGVIQNTVMYSSHEAAGKPDKSDELVSLTYFDAVPVITIRKMGFPDARDDWEANKFLEYAEKVKDEPVLIIDLRSNGGGNGLLAQIFYEKLTGSFLTPNHYSLTRLVFGPDEPEPNPDTFYYTPLETNRYYKKPEIINDSWKLENPEPRQVVDRDQLLIILTSKGTASAADNFTDITFNLKNSLVIGSNTAGVMISSASIGVKAPNTGVIGQMGFNLAVYDPGHFQEGIGIMPDIWTSKDALEAALALVKNMR